MERKTVMSPTTSVERRTVRKKTFQAACRDSARILLWFGILSLTGIISASEPLIVGVIARYDEHGAGIPFETALTMGVKAIQIKAPFPENRTEAVADEILTKCREKGIVITSIQSGFTGESYKTIEAVRQTVGLVPKETRADRIDQFRDVCDFARLLHLEIVCFHFGFVPHDPSDPDYTEAVETARIVCDDARNRGLRIHLETGQETGEVLLRFIQNVDRDNLFINFDPANMILYGCGDPIETLDIVGPLVKSVHCKDAIWAKNRGTDWGTEVPFGDGDVRAAEFFRKLRAVSYEGPFIVERENRGEPEKQARSAQAACELIENLKTEIWKQSGNNEKE